MSAVRIGEQGTGNLFPSLFLYLFGVWCKTCLGFSAERFLDMTALRLLRITWKIFLIQFSEKSMTDEEISWLRHCSSVNIFFSKLSCKHFNLINQSSTYLFVLLFLNDTPYFTQQPISTKWMDRALVDPRWRWWRTPPPLGAIFLSISCSIRDKMAKIIGCIELHPLPFWEILDPQLQCKSSNASNFFPIS